jgi:hypothetical protein
MGVEDETGVDEVVEAETPSSEPQADTAVAGDDVEAHVWRAQS